MNKSRVEAFSDGVFSIVMTLLVFDLRLPTIVGAVSNKQLWAILATLSPLVASYFLSFLVLAVFWINHNFLFHSLIKKVDRRLNLMNLVYLMFLVFIPFSANLFGTYPYNEPAALVYGLNILAVMAMSGSILRYLAKHKDLRNELSPRVIKHIRVRTALTEGSYVLGIIASFLFIPASVFFYLFPMLFNILPGSTDIVERLFRFEMA